MEKKNVQDSKKPKSAKVDVDAKAVKDLAKILNDTALTEIEYETEICRIRVVKNPAISVATQPVSPIAAQPAPTSPALPQEAKQETVEHTYETHPGAIKAPMVGTVYLAPQPGAAPFVQEGDQVKEGETLMIIEAMKVMNPIKASQAGTVKKVLVHDGEPVEFDHPLIVIA